jgi:hypothetical protein
MDFLFAILLMVVFFFCGFMYGFNLNLSVNVKEIMRHYPINVKISKVEDQYLAHLLHNNEFICQDTCPENLVKKMTKLFPNKLIVIKDDVHELL